MIDLLGTIVLSPSYNVAWEQFIWPRFLTDRFNMDTDLYSGMHASGVVRDHIAQSAMNLVRPSSEPDYLRLYVCALCERKYRPPIHQDQRYNYEKNFSIVRYGMMIVLQLISQIKQMREI